MRAKRDNTPMGGGVKSLTPTNTKQDSGEKRRTGWRLLVKRDFDRIDDARASHNNGPERFLTIKVDAKAKSQAV